MEYPRPSIGNTNSFLSSGTPYVSGSSILSGTFSTLNGEKKFVFPRVARSVTVINKGDADIRVHFNSLADGRVINGGHFITLDDPDDSMTFTSKCNEIYISLVSSSNGSVEIYADITNIPRNEMFALTGSGLTD